ncbi:MAG: MMPL family transporter [Propionibacteriales bacterium]|nr:MMPL family transporter [Propionibacteriales bacterium]
MSRYTPGPVSESAHAGRLARLIAGRRTKWMLLAAWVVMLAVAFPISGRLMDVQENDEEQWLPGDAESTAAAELADRFEGSGIMPASVVYHRDGGVTDRDRAVVEQARTNLQDVAVAPVPPVEAAKGGEALLLVVPLEEEDIEDPIGKIENVAERAPPGLQTHVAGPAGMAYAMFSAFDGADVTLFMAAAAVVTILLLLIYRSLVLWILPVISAGIAVVAAQAVVVLLAENEWITVNGQSAGILPVLVFAAGTDYALLLLARYREELHRHEDRHRAMAVALHRSGPAIVASSATVALGMLCLLVADLASNKGLGPVAAAGVLGALLSITTLLPVLLVVLGRWIFWPVRPHAGTPIREDRQLWGWIGRKAARRPRLVWVATALVLGAGVLGLTGLKTGLDFEDQFTSEPDAVAGERMIADNFPTDQAFPAEITANRESVSAVREAAGGVDGVTDVLPAETSTDGVLVKVAVMLEPAGPDRTGEIVEELRAAVHDVPGADAVVGGTPAAEHDVAVASAHDRAWIPPLVLGVILLVLIILLRALVAPVLLVATVVLSFAAAAGVSWLLFDQVLGFEAVDQSWLILGFVLLVALGVDYNIFLAHRVREEVGRLGHRAGVLRGLAVTGGVITSAGVVLAATFGVLALIPLVSMTEMGVLVALGVLIDTFLVRSLLVPMLALDVGPRFWWPGRPDRRTAKDAPESPGREPELVGAPR